MVSIFRLYDTDDQCDRMVYVEMSVSPVCVRGHVIKFEINRKSGVLGKGRLMGDPDYVFRR